MYVGPHHAKAPATNATHVNPAVESKKEGFLNKFFMSSEYDEGFVTIVPSLRPLMGSYE